MSDRPLAGDSGQNPWLHWRRGERPAVDAVLASLGGLSASEVVAVLLVDQRERWTNGERVPAADYLRDFPALRDDPELAVELIYAEFLLRAELGEAPELEEYQRSYSDHAERLEVRDRLHRLLADHTGEITEATIFGSAGLTRPPGPDVEPRGPRGAATLPAWEGYAILEELGRGGMGVVYKARDLRLDRVVALKRIRDGKADSPESLARLLREAQVIARLRHPNIVQIYDVGERDGRPYIELEYAEGGSLDRRLSGTGWPAPEAARLVATLAEAIQEAHRQGIVHRDLKPANVLLDADGTPKVTDFGLAKCLEGEPGHATPTGAILGTPSYMAPEQAAGGMRGFSPLVDVYALGAILYELLTGRPPFSGAWAVETLIRARESDPDRPRLINPAVPRDLEVICLKAMAREPGRRYPSAHALAEDLARFLDGRPIQARPAGRAERLCRWCWRNPALAGLSLLTLLLLMTVVVLIAGMVGRNPATPGDGSLRRVLHAGKLVIATDPNYPPMEYRRDGRLVGFDVELGRHLARRLGVRAEFVPIAWEWAGVVSRLNAHDFDVVISSVIATEDRERQVDFVEYLRLSLVFVCRRGAVVRRGQDLAGKVVAVQEDTIARQQVDELEQRGVAIREVVVLPGTIDPLEAVRSGRAEVALVHEPVGRHFAGQDGDVSVTGSLGHAMDPPPLGIVICEGDKDLQAAVEREIRAMKRDQSFAKLLEDWCER